MEGDDLNWQSSSIVNELTQGMKTAKQLRFNLCATSPSEEDVVLLQNILSSYDKALSILKRTESQPASGAPESSVSINGSPRRENFRDHQDQVSAYIKRKMQASWTEQVRVDSEHGLGGPADDGYSWRKYGQKHILGAKFPRSYYRCTFRQVQDCLATKQVQRSDDDITIFCITYKGTHTCNWGSSSVPQSTSPEKQELKHNAANSFGKQNQAGSNLKDDTTVNTEKFGNEKLTTHFSFQPIFAYNETENHYFPIPTHADENSRGKGLLTRRTPQSNHFSSPAYQIKSYEVPSNFPYPEAETVEITSAYVPTSNSPIGGTECYHDLLDLVPNLPFKSE